MPHNASERPRKRVKLDQSAPHNSQCASTDFLNICKALPTQDLDVLSKALSTLRSKLSFQPDQTISPHDERLLLIEAWLEASPGLQDVFDVWERIDQLSTLATLVTILASTLSLLSSHFSYHSYGVPIIKTLLSVHWVRRLNNYFNGSHNDLILATLTLFNAMSAFGGGRERKSVFEVFPWDNKTLTRVLRMRRRSRDGGNGVTLSKPDIRTLYVLFILSFVDRGNSSSVKIAFLEERREVFLSIFRGLAQDPFPVIQRVLEVCWEGLWSDPKVSRSLKIAAFNEATICHLVTLYDRAVPEGVGSVIPADIVHHFLLAVCSRPGQGICFRDCGWYPRETEEGFPFQEENIEVTYHKTFMSGKVYNKILAKVLPILKVNEDLRQQELALKIFLACPELVAGYWPTAPLTLEPRLSSKWITNIAFAGQVVTLAVPVSSFFLSGSTLYNPTPPPLPTIMANIFPAVGTKMYFTKGLQTGATGLVQHCTAVVLAKCLGKFAEVIRVFEMIAAALEEDRDDGQWIQRQKEVIKEARRRVPEFQAIVAFSQQHLRSQHPQNVVKHSLLGECSQRLLWLYQEHLPGIVAEEKFEVGKLVQTLAEGSLFQISEDVTAGVGTQGCLPLQSVKQLHVLRLLCKSDQFTWNGRASASRTFLGVLLVTLCNSDVRALRVTLLALLRHVLTESVLFQADPSEVDLWLAALPSSVVRRWSGTESPDGAPLTDEVNGVVGFIDDCVQRCLKTPYRYIQAMIDLWSMDTQSPDTTHVNAHVETFASPLLMTVLEQVVAKVNGRLLTPSDTLSVFTFIRRLVIKLATKQEDAEYSTLRSWIRKLELTASSNEVYKDHPSISGALRRELSIMHACLDHHPEAEPGCSANRQRDDELVDAFLTRIEQMPVPENQTARITSAYELVDWLRLVDATLSPANIFRLAAVMRRHHKPALVPLIGFLHPSEGHLWKSNLLDDMEELSTQLDFDWVFVHCYDTHLGDEKCRTTLLRALFSIGVTPSEVERAVRVILHRMSVSKNRPGPMQDLLSLLSSLFDRATSIFDKNIQYIGVAMLAQSPLFEDLCLSLTLAPEVHEALWKVIEAVFDWTNVEDQKILTRIITLWTGTLKDMLSSREQRGLKCAKPWVKFMEVPELLAALGLIEVVSEDQRSPTSEMLEEILASLKKADVELPVTRLLGLQVLLPRSSLLEDMIATSLVSQLPPYHDDTAPAVSSSVAFPQLPPRIHGCLTSTSHDLIAQFMNREIWTDSTARIVAALLYAHVSTSRVFAKWLSGAKWKRLSIDHLTVVLAAFLDCLDPGADELMLIAENELCAILQQLISQWPNTREHRLRHLRCICSLLQRDPERRLHLSSIIESKFQAFPVTDFALETIYIARHTQNLAGCETLGTAFVDRALQWAVRYFSDGCHDEDSQRAIVILGDVCKGNFQLKPHLVESLLTVIIKSHLHDSTAVDVVFSLVQPTQLKPIVVNRVLQSILQHQDFFKLLAGSDDITQKNAITRLLDTLFRLHPANACHPSNIEPLLQVYGGTLSVSDRRLLAIARLFEATTHSSISPFFARWSPSPGTSVTNILEVVQGLDPVKVLRVCLSFPSWRRLVEEQEGRQGPDDSNMYDPLLIFALSAQMLGECPPVAALDWVTVFRSNIVCLLIRSLSSEDPNIRETAACQLAMIWKSVQSSAMHERAQVLYVLRLLKNVMQPSVDGVPGRLSTYVTLIVLHALRGVFYPSNFIYPRTARFLLQRPELDIGDVPMLFGMLYSSSDDWKKERGWIVKMLADGMMSAEDWRVLRRRHTWDLLASLFQNLRKDDTLRAGILGVLANLTCNAQACTSLVLKSALLSWIEMQLTDGSEGEAIAWLRILENVIFVADPQKLTRATNGEWFVTTCRCLIYVLRMSGGMDIGTLYQVALIASRLSLLEKVPNNSIQLVVAQAVVCLKQLEVRIQFCRRTRSEAATESPELTSPPHDAPRLHNRFTIDDPLPTWGKTIEILWRITMISDHKSPVWDTLTSRLLVWRGIAGEEASPIGEWARKETIRMLRTCV